MTVSNQIKEVTNAEIGNKVRLQDSRRLTDMREADRKSLIYIVNRAFAIS